jgi:hypothetical protein
MELIAFIIAIKKQHVSVNSQNKSLYDLINIRATPLVAQGLSRLWPAEWAECYHKAAMLVQAEMLPALRDISSATGLA